ncbi:MAG: CCA tRNA nucleotidyltransferase, partial [Bifidobacteriaceae bacterium]|nr:CCA tRNA nucleotidyltransferase [Bifidobacteriaceae bacterium]
MREQATAALAGLPNDIGELAQLFAAENHELSLVGGTVRDMLLGRSSGDFDFATSAHPAVTERLLSQ